MSESTINLIIRGKDDGATAAIEGVSGKVGGLGAVLGGAGAAAVAGVAVAGAAIVGLGAAGSKAFMDFEGSMNEVFTLMPGMSESAMSEMSQNVLEFSNEFGTLPNEVIPSLYQAISAGVPADNVFSFLETAQMAAIGGVTDLETSVDGISSAVNAYGSDVLSAAQASDIMFTTVKLGKTDFEQLSNSLYNVLPTASALGVGLGDVSAGLATLTAAGVPTSVATTQMRQLFVELSKEGGKAANVFEEMAGQSFKDFIASGGNVQGALTLMEQAAVDSGVGIQDLFGSVEAGSAALGLTGSAASTFSNALAEMDAAMGATATAYDTMDSGLGRNIDRLKAFGATSLVTIGEALSPLLGEVLNLAEGALPVLGSILTGTIVPAIQSGIAIVHQMRAAWDGDWNGIRTQTETAVATIKLIITTVFTGIQAFWAAHGESIKAAASAVWNFISSVINLNSQMVMTVITTVFTGIQAFWAAHGETIKAAASAVWEAIKSTIETVTSIISDIWLAFQAAREGDWYAFGEHLRDAFDTAWLAIKTNLENAWDAIKEIFSTAIQGVINKFAETDWGDVGRNIVAGIANGIRSGAGAIADAARSAAAAALAAAKGFLGIESPSRVAAAQIGAPFAQGVAVGAENEMNQVSGQIQRSLDTKLMGGLRVGGNGGVKSQSAATVVNHTYYVEINDTRAAAVFIDYLESVSGRAALASI